MVRLYAYAGTSVGLAAAVMLKAFSERPNFYSACVHLAQSNICLGILVNLCLLCAGTFLIALQRLLYGTLRPIELEQLYEKAWFAITETALAMTIFRDELGGWFLVMFVALMASKVWGWIGEGRVEVLEQQPPANPRLFHARLSASLIVGFLFNAAMLNSCVNIVLEQARPGMMVMYAFEFALLSIGSVSSIIRYLFIVREQLMVKEQTNARINERRVARRAERIAAGEIDAANAPPLSEEEVDDIDIDVPGWEDKGRWIFYLDLATDLLKLLVYMFFFVVLLTFHGLPIHIMRDVYITARSFVKRIGDFLRYRNATKDMNARYPDATAEDLANDSTCIVCREEMRPWQPPTAGQPAPTDSAQQRFDERLRPKKLPCGHILHLGCLKSWLERQQVCPTCRRSVLAPQHSGTTGSNNPNPAPGHGQRAAAGDRPQENNQRRNGNRNPWDPQAGLRQFNFGPVRIGFGVFNANQFAAGAPAGAQNPVVGNNAATALPTAWPEGGVGIHELAEGADLDLTQIQERLDHIRTALDTQVQRLEIAGRQLGLTNALLEELARLQVLQSAAGQPATAHQPGAATAGTAAAQAPLLPVTLAGVQQQQPGQGFPYGAPLGLPPLPTIGNRPQNHFFPAQAQAPTSFRAYETPVGQEALGTGHPDLPAGLTLPEGWTLVPLNPLASRSNQPAPSSSGRPSSQVNGVASSSDGMAATATAPQVQNGGAVTSIPTVQATDSNIGLDAAPSSAVQGTSPLLPSQTPQASTPRPASSSGELPSTQQISLSHWGFDDIPTAGEDARSPPTNGEASHIDLNGSTEAEASQDAEARRAAKGKGKAVSVEDAPEDQLD